MGVGIMLKTILRERGMTIKRLAELADVPLNTLYSITKRDSERVDSVILMRISRALGVPVASLLPGDPLDLGGGLQGYKVDGRLFLTKESLDAIKKHTNLTADEVAKLKKMDEEAEAMLSEWEAERDAPSELKILQAYHKLNLDGQYEAVKRVEELTEIPRYQATFAPQSTPSQQVGTDTTLDKKPPGTPPKGE